VVASFAIFAIIAIAGTYGVHFVASIAIEGTYGVIFLQVVQLQVLTRSARIEANSPDF
jgi:hypothetical protein